MDAGEVAPAFIRAISRKQIFIMKIFRAIGIGVFFLILITFMPDVFVKLQETLVSFFDTLQNILQVASSMNAGMISGIPVR